MKITWEIKQQIQFLLLKMVMGQINDLSALIEAMEVIIVEAKIQNGPQP